jgi:hypothetical protein
MEQFVPDASDSLDEDRLKNWPSINWQDNLNLL